MAGMSTALVKFADNGNSRTSTVTGHTALKPRLVVERRVIAEGKKTLAENHIKVIYATVDAEGLPLRDKVAFEAIVKTPIAGLAADVSAALVVFRDIVAGDEFATMVTTQQWLKA